MLRHLGDVGFHLYERKAGLNLLSRPARLRWVVQWEQCGEAGEEPHMLTEDTARSTPPRSVEGLLLSPDHLSLIPGFHTVEGENWLPQVIS